MYKLVIVDDNKRALNKMKDILDWERYNIKPVAFCHDGEEAWEYILNNSVDLIISDVKMPQMDGVELLKMITEKQLKIKFIFVSCFDDFSFVKSAVDMEAASYILKPVNVDDLRTAVCKVLNLLTKDEEKNEEKRKAIELIKKSEAVLRDAYLRELLTNPVKFGANEDISQKMDLIGLNYSETSSFIVICIKVICNNENAYRDIESLAIVANMLKEIECTDMSANSIVIDMETICTVLSFENKDEEYITKRLIEIKEKERNNPMYHTIWGISSYAVGIDKVYTLYKEAKQAAWADEVAGNDIIFFNELFNEPLDQFINIERFQSEINEIIQNESIEDAKEFIDKYFVLNPQTGKIENKYIVYLLLNIIENYIHNYNEVEKIDFQNFWRKTINIDSIENIKQWFLNIFNYLFECISKSSISKKKLAEKIEEIIKNDYGKNITKKYLSEKLFYSGAHLNNVFKHEYGVGIFEYLTAYRIKKAKKLLLEPDCKLYKIVEEIGYKNQAHFKYIFTKHTGMTPKEYQLRYSKIE